MDSATEKSAVKMDLSNELPLGWTKVQRKRLPATNRDTDEGNGIDECCDDPSCARKKPRTEMMLLGNASNALGSSEIRKDEDDGTLSPIVEGVVVICLPDVNPSWFQGYLQLKGFSKPWGLLGEQQELDACLQCSDGGYRQVSLTLFPFDKTNKDDPSIVLNDIDWRGGDMMYLQGEDICVKPDRMWTGSKTLPFLDKYFGDLVHQIRDRAADQGSDVLDILPNVGIVTGNIQLRLPSAPR